MKKLYLMILAVGLGSIISAQNTFTIITPTNATADMVTPTNTNVTGDTAEFFNASILNTIVGPLWVINNTGAMKTVKVRRTQLSIIPGSANFFCWDLCYAPGTSVSNGTVSIAAGDTAILFYADYNPNMNGGTSYIKYKFFEVSDTTQMNEVTVKFTSGTVGIEDEKPALTSVYPNPASDIINFDYYIGNNNGKIIISDITGKIVRNIIIGENSTKQSISLEGLVDGIYIYSFYVNNKAVSTKKFIVKK